MITQNRAPRKIEDLMGVGPVLAARVARHFGFGDDARTLELISQAPYRLMEIDRFGFAKADKIALHQFGWDSSDSERHRLGNQSILEGCGQMPLDLFRMERRSPRWNLNESLGELEGVILDTGRVWLERLVQAEQGMAAWMLEQVNRDAHLPTLTPMSELEERETRFLDPVQRSHALNVLRSSERILALTGGAGTGKTATLAAITALFRSSGQTVAVGALAGKAADRVKQAMSQAIKQGIRAEATVGTLHRLLGYRGLSFAEGMWGYNLVILEESSMIPVDLAWEVVKRMGPNTRLLWVGDEEQLPPVGYGTPFRDLLEYGLPRLHLTQNYRSAHVQGIIHLANTVRVGERCEFAPLEPSVEQHFGGEDEDVMDRLIGEHTLADFDEWQVITHTKDTCYAMNKGCQELLNPEGELAFTYRVEVSIPAPDGKGGTKSQKRLETVEVRVGDKILVNSNAYDYNLFNGQLYRLIACQNLEAIVREYEPADLSDWSLIMKDRRIEAHFNATGKIPVFAQVAQVVLARGLERVHLPLEECGGLLRLGYCITLHKAQGSDWEHVIVYQPQMILRGRSWWYTAVTRAKTRLSVVWPRSEDKWWPQATSRPIPEPSTLMGRAAKLMIEKRTQARLEYAVRQPEPDFESWLA